MWIEDVNGDLVNLDNCKTLILQYSLVEIYLFNSSTALTLFESDDPAECQTYMVELKKELAAFGKLIKIELT